MAIQLLYFAWVRERIGRDGERVEPPSSVETVADLLDWLSASSGAHAGAFADHARLRAAIDQQFAPLSAPLGDAREVAIFPPVTGG